LGVTPSAWNSGTAIQNKANSSWFSDGSSGYFATNAYYSTGFKYTATGAATQYIISSNGQHQWFNAPSGTAGNAITFTQAMTLDASGNLVVGQASASARFHAVSGSVGASTLAQIMIGYSSGSTNYYDGNTQIFRNGSATETMRIASAGQIGIGGANYGTSGQVLTSGGSSAAPTWGAVSLTSQISGTLPVANGGTGQTTYTDGQLLIGNSTGNTLTKATLTAGSGVTITNAAGSITIASSGGSSLPSQTGNAGKFLTTDATNASWAAVTATTVSDTANSSTGYFQLPQGTTAQRPGTPTNGMTRINTTTNTLEVYSTYSSSWNTISTFSATPPSVEYLVVAGGGAGGGTSAGGGGAGGFRTATGLSVSAGTSYTVTVGAGGTAVSAATGGSGSNSVFSSITSTGGGGGGGCSTGETSAAVRAGAAGGSGGGGGGSGTDGSGAGSGGTGTSGQGSNGGTSGTSPAGNVRAGGGGGGASATGANASGNTAGNGGNGTASSISGSSVTYAGGGGGGTRNDYWGSGNTVGTGGTGGGANGAGVATDTAGVGTVNTGGGGGGGSYASSVGTSTGGNGGSGIVIIRYADTYGAASTTTGSPTITVAGGYRVYKWTGSGTITF
jgi:hypothetical protein